MTHVDEAVWLHHVTHVDEAVYPGRLTMATGGNAGILEFKHLVEMSSKYESARNKWVHETVWCKLAQWYGVDDAHELDRCNIYSEPGWGYPKISLKGDPGTSLEANTSKRFSNLEECGYIELQLRRIFGVTHGTVTQLWLGEKTPNPTLLDRSKALIHYADIEVR